MIEKSNQQPNAVIFLEFGVGETWTASDITYVRHQLWMELAGERPPDGIRFPIFVVDAGGTYFGQC